MEKGLNMNKMLLYLCVKIRKLALHEGGQDLVEYALVVAMIAFAATAGRPGSLTRPIPLPSTGSLCHETPHFS